MAGGSTNLGTGTDGTGGTATTSPNAECLIIPGPTPEGDADQTYKMSAGCDQYKLDSL